jgi:ankyrin repeat protein
MRLLLGQEDVALDFNDQTGRTLLFWAEERGHDAVVKLLVGRKYHKVGIQK